MNKLSNYLKISFIVILFFIVLEIYAESGIIITKDGHQLKVFNIELGPKSIYYTEDDSFEAPLKRIDNEEVFGYKIGDGEMMTIQSSQNSHSDNSINNTGRIVTKGDENNERLKSKYSSGNYSWENKKEGKEAKGAFVFYKLTENSVISSNDLEIEFEIGLTSENEWVPYHKYISERQWVKSASLLELKIYLINKTEQPLYIDLSKTIRNGEIPGGYRVFYDGTQTIQGGGTSNSIGIPLLGLGIGASNSSSSTIIKNQPNILILPPKSKLVLPPYSEFNDYDKKIYNHYDALGHKKRNDKLSSPGRLKNIKENEIISFDESDSPSFISYEIVYSENETFESSKAIDFQLYIAEAIGLKQIFNIWSGKFEDRIDKIQNMDDKTFVGSVKLK